MDNLNQKSEEKIIDIIREQIKKNKILLYMKGSPQAPQCGFSAQAVAAIRTYVNSFSFIDILKNPDIRAALPKYANWPTFPQLYVNGELIGGCDIILELHKSNELQAIINQAK